MLWCCKASIFIDQLPQAQQFTAAAQLVFKVHWGYSSPGRKNNLYLCEYRWHFFPFSLMKKARANIRCLLPACTQVLRGQPGGGWTCGQGCQGGGCAGAPADSSGLPPRLLTSLQRLLPAGFNCTPLQWKSSFYGKMGSACVSARARFAV